MRFIELFCGIGGFRLGLEKANSKDSSNSESRTPQHRECAFRCVWSNDNDKYACQIYRKQFREVCEQDIRTVDPSTIPEHDLLTAGFPCQSFSIAGKRGGFEDTRGTLFFEICRIARAKRTKYLLLENVKGLLSHDNGDTFQTILRTLDELGYDCQWQVLNSKDFDVPQNRERVFIIGHLRGQPRPQIFPIREPNQESEQMDERNGQVSPAIQARDWRGQGKQLDNLMIFRYGVMGENNKRWLEDGKEFSRNFPQGQRVYSDKGISAQLNAQAGGWGAKTGLYEIGCQRQNQGENIGLVLGSKHESIPQIRRLTPLECERLQGFPDNWTGGISDTQRYKCLGNAVTVNVIEVIGRQFLEGLR